MDFFPLESISLNEAKEMQFKIIDCICSEFKGHEILERGDLGVNREYGKPIYTLKAENVLKRLFNVEDCIFVRGSGTSAIRYGLHAILKANDNLLIHDAPMYSTSQSSIEMLGLNTIKADFNNDSEILKKLNENIDGVLIQYTRQLPGDKYNMGHVISLIKDNSDLPIITDDNYACLKVKKIGVELGSDLSAFSSFKLLGPEGIGILLGKEKYIRKIKEEHYSGGMQVQGHEAIDVLRGLVYAPVSLAIQKDVVEEVNRRLNSSEVKGVKKAYIANSQSKVILVEFNEDIAEDVLKNAEKFGAAPFPIGSESKYEFVPMFYRISGSFIKYYPDLKKRMIRINPMRAGADTIINILEKSMELL